MLSQRIRDIGVVGLIVLSGLGCGRGPFDDHDGLHIHEPFRRAAQTAIGGTELTFTFFMRDQSEPLTCAVTAPSGASVDCAASAWELDEFWHEHRSSVTFTPTEVGVYLVRATLKADEFLSSIYVMEPPGAELATLGWQCSWVEPFTDGAWLCDGVFLRELEIAQTFDAQLIAAAEDVVWTFKNGSVARLREPPPGELVGPPTVRVDTGITTARALLATANDVLVVFSSGVLRVDAQGTTVNFERPIASTAVLRRVGETLVIAEQLVPFVIGTDPNGAQLGEETEVCVFSISATEIAEQGCRRYRGTLQGESDEGVVISAPPDLLEVTTALDDGLRMPMPSWLSPNGTPTPRGLAIFGGGVIAKRTDGALHWQSFQGATGASGPLVWSVRENSTVVWSR